MNKGRGQRKIRFKKIHRKALSMILAVSIVLGLSSGCQKTKAPDLEEPAGGSLQGMQVEKKDIEQRMILTGYVAGKITGYYYKEQKSKLEYMVKLGDKITKGQALVAADTQELEEQLEDLSQELEGVRADLDYQKEFGQLNQKKLSVLKKYASKKERESAANELERAEINQSYQQELLSLQASNLNKEINDIKEQIEENTLYAEEDGYVSYIGYTQYAEGFKNVVVVTGTDTLHIALENELEEKESEQFLRAYIMSDGKQTELKEIPYTEAERKIAEKSNMILTPRFELADKKLAVGDYVTVFLVMKESRDTCVVSKSCVYQSENGSYVYRIDGKKKEKCFVETGVESGDEVEIVKGLSDGDMVFYPVAETVKYEGTQEVSKESVFLKTFEKDCRLYYPSFKPVNTRVGEAELTYIAEEGSVEKGDLLAKVSLSSGKADVKEAENQISSLKKQYQAQKSMHEKTIKLLKKEIQSLQSTKNSASSPAEQDITEQGTAGTEQPVTQEPDKTEAGSTEEQGVDDKTQEKEEKKMPAGKTEESDNEYPVSVQISIKQLGLSMEQLAKAYDEKSYNRRIKQLTRLLEQLQRRTGEISIYAECSGTFEGNYTANDIGRLLAEDAELGLVNDSSVSYLQILNKENILRYGNPIMIKEEAGAEYAGNVAGAYPSGSIDLTVQSEYGEMDVELEADDNQKNAYIQVPGHEGIQSGTVVYRSGEIKNVIAIDKSLLKKEEQNYYVWILKEGKPFKQYVEHNIVAEDKAWILKGLSDTDTLLTGVK